MARSHGLLVSKGSGRDARYDMLGAAYPAWKSCLVFGKNSPLRKFCAYTISSEHFDRSIFFVILCNCVTLCLNSNRQGFDSTSLGKALAILDYVYIGIFTAEMILKAIAMGFVLRRGTYLRDGWNVLDFLVVVMGYISFLSPSNLTAIRAFRAMRPLRTINRVKGMKVLVTTMIGSLPLLLDVFVLCAFTFFMFSLIAVQLFAGVLRYRCGAPDFSGAYAVADSGSGGAGDGAVQPQQLLANVSYVVPEEQAELMCSGPLSSDTVWYLMDGAPTAVPGKGYAGRVCDDGMYCTLYGNPSYGLLSYDTILWSWLTVFQHITLSGWSGVMYMVMDAVNFWVWVFYLVLIVLGAFFMVNLALAVLAVKFSADSHEEEEQEERVEGRATEQEAAPGLEQRAGGADAQVAAAVGRSCVSSPSRLVAALKIRRDSPAEDDNEGYGAVGSPAPAGRGPLRRLAWRLAVSRGLELTTMALILVNTGVMCINWYGMPYSVERATNYINYVLTAYFAVEVVIRITAAGGRFFRSGMNAFDFLVVVVSVVEMVIDLVPSLSGVGPLSVLRAFRLLRVFRLARNWRELNAILNGMFKSVQASLALVALTALFIFVAALVGMQVFGYEFMFCDYVAGASAVCPPGQEVWGECPNHFHCYLPCAADQYGSWVDAPGSFYNGLAYCDRFCAGAGTTESAAANASSEAVAAAGAGGCEYLAMVGKSQVPRAQFDNILWGMYTVFQLLTGENWNDIMMDAMRTVSVWASLYFVGVILIGNYLVFNLFIAILLDNLDLKLQAAATAPASSDAAAGASSRGGRKDSKRPSTSPSASALTRPAELGHGTGAEPMDRGGWGGTGGGATGGGGDGCNGAAGSGFTGGASSGERASPAALEPSAFREPVWGPEAVSRLGPEAATETAPALAPAPPSRKQRGPEWPWPEPCLLGQDPGSGISGAGDTLPAAEASAEGSPTSSPSRTSSTFVALLLPLPPQGLIGGAETAVLGRSPSAAAVRTPSVLGSSGAAAAAAATAATAASGVATAAATPAARSRRPSAPALVPAAEPASRAGPLAESVEAPAASEGGRRGAGEQGELQRCDGTRPGPLPPPLQQPSTPLAPCPSPWRPSPACAALPPSSMRTPVAAPAPASKSASAAVEAAAAAAVVAAAAAAAPAKAPPLTDSSTSCSDSVGLPLRCACVAAAMGRGELSSSPDLPLHPQQHSHLPLASTLSSLSHSEQQLQQQQLQQQVLHDLQQQAKQTQQQQEQQQHHQPHHLNHLNHPNHPNHQHQEIPRLPPRSVTAASFLSKDAVRNALQSLPLPLPFPSIRSSRKADAASIAPPGPPWRDVLRGRALLLLGPDHPLRRACAAVVHNWWFEGAILAFILASCVCLVLDAPGLDPSSRLAAALGILDYVFTALFTVEAILKIMTFGFAFTGKHAYVRSGWNVLDLAIVALGWALIIVQEVGLAGAENVKVLRVLRALRALRPLRAVHGFPGLKVVVNTLFAVLPSMVHVALVCVFFYLIFAILAVNLFKGKLYNCVDAASGERIDPFYVLPAGEVLTRAWCEAGSQTINQSAYFAGTNVTLPGYEMETRWVNPTANFDNVGVAMLTLFQVATLSLWVDITFTAVDATHVDQQPLWNHNPGVVLLFIVFIVVCTFFVLNLFVGVTLDKFAEMHQAHDAPTAFLTPQQRAWVDTQRLLLRAEAGVRPPPPRPPGRLRGALYSLAAGRPFEVAMLLVIAANVTFMAAVHWGMSPAWQAVMSYSNIAFTAIFVVEAALKMTAFGPVGYFGDGWNRFDFIVVAVSVTSVALDFSDTRAISFMPVLRVLRVVRVVRLVRHARGMQKLVRTLVTSLPALANVGGVMLIFFFVFAVIGVNLFAGIKEGEAIDSHANFNNFPNAMLLLFRMITGEGWDAIMQDCMATDACMLVLYDINVTLPDSAAAAVASITAYPPSYPLTSLSTLSPSLPFTLPGGTYLDPHDPLLAGLPPNATDDQCPLSPVAAIIYFPLFVVLCTFILLQLVIAVLLENLIEADEEDGEGEEEEEDEGDGGQARAELARGVMPRSAIESFTRAWVAAAAEAATASDGGGGGRRSSSSSWGRRRRGLLHVSRLPGVLEASDPPLGARGSAHPRRVVHQGLLRMRVPLYEGGEVSFIEVLHSLTGSLCGTALPPSEQAKLGRELSKRLPRVEPHAKYTAAHYHAGKTVAAAIRGCMLRHKHRGELAACRAEVDRCRRQQQEAKQPQQQQQQQLRRPQQPQQQPQQPDGKPQPGPQQPQSASWGSSSAASWFLWLLGLSRPAPAPSPAPAPDPAPAPTRSSLVFSLVSLPLRYLFGLPFAVIRVFLYRQPTRGHSAGLPTAAGHPPPPQQQQQQQQRQQGQP